MFFLFILVILFVIGFTIHTSKIGIKIENFKIDTEKPKGNKINKDKKIIIYLIIFNKIELFKRNVENLDKQKINIPENIKTKVNYKEILENIKIDIRKIDLIIHLGTEDASLTAILTGILSGILGGIIRKPKYEIIPVYSNKNFLRVKLNCIISVSLMQYIYKLIFNKIKDLKNDTLNKKVEG